MTIHRVDECKARLNKAIRASWAAIERQTQTLAATTDVWLAHQIRRNRIEVIKTIRYCRANLKTCAGI